MPAAQNGLKICSNPNCIHGGKPQPIDNFNKCARSKDGLNVYCKDCRKKYREENKDKIIEQKKTHYKKNFEKIQAYKKMWWDLNKEEKCKERRQKYEENKDTILAKQKEDYKQNKEKYQERSKKYRCQNKEKLSEHSKAWRKALALYDTYFDQISKYEECQRDPENLELIQVKCKYCGKFFNPSNGQLQARLNAINRSFQYQNRSHGECNLYCSKACKLSCPSYRKRTPNGKIKQNTSREVQPELRKMVLARDNWTCQKCGKSKEDFPELVLHCHHIDPVKSNPIESADIDNCVTFCKECHKWVHKNIPGCSLADLRKCINT